MADLTRLTRPRSIAVIGGRECERVVEQCDRLGFAGTIHPVHPKRETLRGRACVPTVADLPSVPDAAYVAVNREASIAVVRHLAAMGCGGVVAYAAGFAEAEDEGAAGLQERLIEAAGAMPLVGPNCYGFVNALDRVALWPDQHGCAPVERGVAIVTQSSNLAINLTMQARGLPIAAVMTAGNQAQLGLSALGQAWLEDERITALGLHIEGLDDVHAFEALANRARVLGKPVIALKVGRSEQARAAALTHTASLAGSHAAHEALFRRLGVASVTGVEAFLETLKLAHAGGPLSGRDVLSLSCSGGEAGLMADAAEGRCLRYRPFRADETARLKAIVGPIVTVSNPFDYNTFVWGDWETTRALFEAALAPGFDLAMLVMDVPPEDRCDPADWLAATQAFRDAVAIKGARAAVVSSIPETMPSDLADTLMAQGIAPLCGFDAALEAAAALADAGEAWSRGEAAPLPCVSRKDGAAPSSGLRPPSPHGGGGPGPSGLAPLPQGKRVPDRSGEGARFEAGDAASRHRTLDESEAKRALAAFGVNVPHGTAHGSAEGLHPPFAVKALGIAHKTEAGGVRLGVDWHDLSEAVEAMTRHTGRVLVEEMLPRPAIAELIVGVTHDPVVGLVLTLGSGGVLAELVGDVATLLLPASEADIRAAIASLKVRKLLDGWRGADAADIDALVANVMCVAAFAQAHADRLVELDVNPLAATWAGACALDALIVMETDE